MDRSCISDLATSAVTCLLLSSGCYSGITSFSGGGPTAGDDVDDSGDDEGSSDDDPLEPADLQCREIGSQPLRRLSAAQYHTVLDQLLPAALAQQAHEGSLFPDTIISDGFSTYASANTTSSGESTLIEDNAERIADLFYEGRAQLAPALMPCLSEGYQPDAIDGCFGEWVEDFGRRAFRREMSDAEHAIVTSIYQAVRDTDGPERGLASVLEYFVQAPALLYATERSDAEGEYAPVAPHELATRLSLFLTNGAPDQELLAAVEEGRLVSREDVEREARRLVAGPEAAVAFADFHHEWMRGYRLEREERYHDLLDEPATQGLREELRSFARWFLEDTDGRYQTLMTTQTFAPDPRLDSVYEAGGPGAERAGLLTTAAAMASHAHEEGTSIIQRGIFVLDQVLCIPVQAFPGDIDTETPLESSKDLPTARERLQPLLENPQCAPCHLGFNPLGFPFEVYDHAGAFRATENEATIDTSAQVELGELSGEFANAAELIEAMAATEQAHSCYARQWFRYGLGRAETPEDECTLDAITEAFVAADGDVRELLVQIATSDAFLFRKMGDL